MQRQEIDDKVRQEMEHITRDPGVLRAVSPRRRTEVGPEVPGIIKAMVEERGRALALLRDSTMSREGVEERVLYDGFCREWTPAYYVGPRQLFHVHNFRSGLRATMFVGENTLQPVLLDSQEVPEEQRLMVASTRGYRGTKQVKVPLATLEDVVGFMELVRVKLEFYLAGRMAGPVNR